MVCIFMSCSLAQVAGLASAELASGLVFETTPALLGWRSEELFVDASLSMRKQNTGFQSSPEHSSGRTELCWGRKGSVGWGPCLGSVPLSGGLEC